MAVDGTYRVELDMPMGKIESKLTLQTEGGTLSGNISSPMGTMEFSGGTVNGDDISWEMEINSPLGKVNLEYTLKVSGDDISGEVKAGNFGSSLLKGKRV